MPQRPVPGARRTALAESVTATAQPSQRDAESGGTAGPRSLLVVGAGLIGTSIALAAADAGLEVWIADHRSEHTAAAVALGAGRLREATDELTVDHAVVCVPPASVVEVLHKISTVATTLSDICGVKSHVQQEVETAPWRDRYTGGHPMAGRERAGPWHARADLFRGRAWVVTPTPVASARAVADATALARLCGARAVVRTPADHDRAVAAVSHLPQLVASALAARLVEVAGEDLELAGQGLRDTTRIAASDPALWADLVGHNAAAVADLLGSLVDELAGVRAALLAEHAGGAGAASRAVADVVARGNRGIQRLPGKHGAPAGGAAALVLVVVADRPGELSRLLAQVASTGVNVEDIRVDHAPGRAAGVVELAVAPGSGESVSSALRREGWAATLAPAAQG